jgi:homoserine O-acetyltransferase/O-succinyltransferase
VSAADLGSGRSRRQFLGALAAVSVARDPAAREVFTDGQLPREGTYSLGDVTLESGAVLRKAFIGYKTHGRLNADRTNGILYPTQFAAQHGDIEWLIGPGSALDSDLYFIIVVDQLGNGVSSSPSNTAAPQDRSRFPAVTIRDDVSAQHRLVAEGFNLQSLALVTGYSMGAQQAFQWAVSHPDFVKRIVPFCGTARTTPHNAVFLEGVRAALTTDAAWLDGDYTSPPVRGLRAMARVYAGWGFSQPFYKRELYRALGFQSLEDVLTEFWEARYMRRDANNLLSMLRKWQLNDVGASSGGRGDLSTGLGSIKAKAVVMASETDLYFTPADVEADTLLIPGAQFKIIPSLWGHMAGAGLNREDGEFIQREIRDLLAS